MANPTKNAINAVIAEIEEQISLVRQRVQRFKNTVDASALAADKAIQDGIAELNAAIADAVKRADAYAGIAQKSMDATAAAKAAAQKAAAEAEAKAFEAAEKALAEAKAAPKVQASSRYLRAAGSKGNSPKSRGGNNEPATLAGNVNPQSSGTKDAGGEPDRGPGGGGKGRDRDTTDKK